MHLPDLVGTGSKVNLGPVAAAKTQMNYFAQGSIVGASSKLGKPMTRVLQTSNSNSQMGMNIGSVKQKKKIKASNIHTRTSDAN